MNLLKHLVTLLPGALLLGSNLVSAHAGLAVTIPEHDAVLERAPTMVHFEFMAVMTLTNVMLDITDDAGNSERIPLRLPRNSLGQSTAHGQNIDINLPLLEPGTYVLVWQATSLDGHLLIDDLSFTIAPSAE